MNRLCQACYALQFKVTVRTLYNSSGTFDSVRGDEKKILPALEFRRRPFGSSLIGCTLGSAALHQSLL